RVDGQPEAGVRPDPPKGVADRGELLHEDGETGRVELADAPPVRRQHPRAPVGVVEERVHARVAASLDQGIEVPFDVGGGEVGVDGRHGPHGPDTTTRASRYRPSASGRGRACTTTTRRVARVRAMERSRTPTA